MADVADQFANMAALGPQRELFTPNNKTPLVRFVIGCYRGVIVKRRLPMTPPKRAILVLRIAGMLCLAGMVSGCVVVPWEPWHPHYHWR